MVVSPLRYPGGKAKLFDFFANVVRDNALFSSTYCEPYAGGAGLAIRLLTQGFVTNVSLNDVDHGVYSFWKAALRRPDDLCALIEKTPVTIDEWRNQRETYCAANRSDYMSLGFATYFLNRTNRSGIIEGAGPIGGYKQDGAWKLDVRLQKSSQISNILSLAKFGNQIELTRLDALDFTKSKLNERSFFYLDPPYYVKGKKLYKNFYNHEDHLSIAKMLACFRDERWVCSYDDVPQIREIYGRFGGITYSLSYSAGEKNSGKEVMFCSDQIKFPLMRGFDPIEQSLVGP